MNIPFQHALRNNNGRLFNRIRPVAAVALLVLTSSAMLCRAAEAGPTFRLTGSSQINAVNPVRLGAASATQVISFSMLLKPAHDADITSLLAHLYTPGDPLYHKFLTPVQSQTKFAQPEANVMSVLKFMTANGFTDESVSFDRNMVTASGTISQINKAFDTTVDTYKDAGGRTFLVPESDPSIPEQFSGLITGIVGLNTSAQLKPAITFKNRDLEPISTMASPNTAGTGVLGGIDPSDIASIYQIPQVQEPGAGQTFALYELDTDTPGDIGQYETEYKLPTPYPTINYQFLDAVPKTIQSFDGAAEVTLDIDMVLAITPNLRTLNVYDAPNTDQGGIFEWQYIEEQDPAVVSSSWGEAEDEMDPGVAQEESAIFSTMAADGESVFAAAGDYGAYADPYEYGTLVVSDPASQPLVTGVGGTTVNVTPLEQYISEVTWNDGPYDAGGGGVSQIEPIPDYQVGVCDSGDNQAYGSSIFRNVPDVSLNADPDTGYSVYITQPVANAMPATGWNIVGGTSAAAPLWAAFTTLVNQKRGDNLGFANPQIYSIGQSPNHYAADFHDTGGDFVYSDNLYYPAEPGYDNATGWGSFIGTGLYADLAPVNPPKITSFSPTEGPVGSTVTITGTNLGAAVIRFTGEGGTQIIAPIVSAGDTTYVVSVPTGAITGPIYAGYGFDSEAVSSTNFTVLYGAPSIASVTPLSGPVFTEVTVTGTNLTNIESITINGIAVPAGTYSSTSLTQLVLQVPAAATSGYITIKTLGGTATSPKVFEVTPTVSSFTPTVGPSGTSVTIKGYTFTGATEVTFNGIPATFKVSSSTQIVAVVPPLSTIGLVKVSTPSGSGSSTSDFTVVPKLKVSSLIPSFGPVGASFTINGASFSAYGGGYNGVTSVTFTGGKAAVFKVNSDTSLTVTVPAGAVTGPITIVSNGFTVKSGTFTVQIVPASVSGASPEAATVGENVFIYGSALNTLTGIKFNTTSVPMASVTVISANEIEVPVPVGATSGVISVINTKGTYTSPFRFTVQPLITSFTPVTGTAGTVVTITGDNLNDVTVVRFHGVVATISGKPTYTTIKVIVPAGATTGTITAQSVEGLAYSGYVFNME